MPIRVKYAWWYLTRPLRPGHRKCRMCAVVKQLPDSQFQCWRHRRFGSRKRPFPDEQMPVLAAGGAARA